MEVTIKDVATQANVSVTTVSRVLNTPDQVRPALKERVQAAIIESGYRPSRAAQGLRSKKFRAVALAVSDVSNPFFGEMTKVIQATCAAQGYDLVLFDLDTSRQRLLQFLNEVRHYSVDGLILCTSYHLDDPSVDHEIVALKSSGYPVVLVGHAISDGSVPSVASDQREGITKCIEHLRAEGCMTIGFLGDIENSIIGRERLASFEQVLSQLDLPVNNRLVRHSADDLHSGYRTSLEMLAGGHAPDGIICAGDQIAIGTMRAARELGLDVPRELAVIGFDNTPICPFLPTPLSSVRLDTDVLGEAAAHALFESAAPDSAKPSNQTFPCFLEIRESSRRRTLAVS